MHGVPPHTSSEENEIKGGNNVFTTNILLSMHKFFNACTALFYLYLTSQKSIGGVTLFLFFNLTRDLYYFQIPKNIQLLVSRVDSNLTIKWVYVS